MPECTIAYLPSRLSLVSQVFNLIQMLRFWSFEHRFPILRYLPQEVQEVQEEIGLLRVFPKVFDEKGDALSKSSRRNG